MLAALALAATLVRLTPSACPALPADVRQELERRACTIPQVWDDATPHNVIRGRFTSRTENEWAVLCSRNGASAILVFRADGGVDELARRDDADFVTGEASAASCGPQIRASSAGTLPITARRRHP